MEREFPSRDETFAQMDRILADMPPVERACSTCGYAEIPPMPEEGKGWLGTCLAPIPVNVLLHPHKAQMQFAAADAARWDSKRQKPCPAWIAKTAA